MLIERIVVVDGIIIVVGNRTIDFELWPLFCDTVTTHNNAVNGEVLAFFNNNFSAFMYVEETVDGGVGIYV